jgi:hypothetical protein
MRLANRSPLERFAFTDQVQRSREWTIFLEVAMTLELYVRTILRDGLCTPIAKEPRSCIY